MINTDKKVKDKELKFVNLVTKYLSLPYIIAGDRNGILPKEE